ncbi:vacuolar import and degradation protein [Umbelopsis sp. PMI_123]|nr:vacuolar import and degradation protein [Umbelopsis sp. PMI_123]
MFAVRGLGKLIFGDEKNPELISLPNGDLYVTTVEGNKSTREKLFTECQMALRRTSQKFQYQIVVSRKVDSNNPPEDDLEDEQIFLVDERIQFKRRSDGDITSFVWSDVTESSEVFELVCDKSTQEYALETFEATVYDCMYERKTKKSRDEATENDIADIKKAQLTPRPSSVSSREQSVDDLTGLMSKLKTQESKGKEAAGLQPRNSALPSGDAERMIHTNADLHLFDQQSNAFVPKVENTNVLIVKIGAYKYWLSISQGSKPLIAQMVEPSMNPVFNKDHKAFIWNYYEGKNVYSWLLQFSEKDNLDKFKEMFGRCIFEALNQTPFSKFEKGDQDYVINAFEEDSEMNEDDLSDTDEEELFHDVEQDSDNESNADHFADGSEKNKHLQIGYKNARSFVLRGDKIGVFKHTDDDKLQFYTTINNVSDLSGKPLNPKQAMLHQEDSSMILLDPKDNHRAYKMDLERGAVVEEWKAHDYVALDYISPETKYAQMTNTQTLVGISHNALYRIDPRLAGNKLVDSQFKQYISKNDFSVVATTQKGHVAVASNKGDIRLFNEIGKNAKTKLPALGDPIYGLDVTASGRFIVATCSTYLLFLDVENKDQKRRLGFEDDKPIPRRLQLKPEHVAYMQEPINFTPARFNSGPNEETTIVTSTGPYVVSWNLKKIRLGKIYDYVIKKYDDIVVSDNFVYGNDNNIVVALPNDVMTLSKKQLGSPKAILTTPSKNLRSRSNIVNAPY